MASIHKVSFYVVDPNDEYDRENLSIMLENLPDVILHHVRIRSADVGEWSDNHFLNYYNCPVSECDKYFE